VLFSMDAWPGLADGSITLTFRTWTSPQAKVGGRYRVGGMLLEAVAVDRIPTAAITDADARRAGATDRAALLARLGDVDEAWRVELRHLGPDDRIARREDDELGPDELAAIRARLDRFDRSGAWTRSTLRLIERYPGVVSTALARHAGAERAAFKLNVRKLKELGLTESLTVGYRLSPRGEAVLRTLG
jgi:IS5 family transposase